MLRSTCEGGYMDCPKCERRLHKLLEHDGKVNYYCETCEKHIFLDQATGEVEMQDENNIQHNQSN